MGLFIVLLSLHVLWMGRPTSLSLTTLERNTERNTGSLTTQQRNTGRNSKVSRAGNNGINQTHLFIGEREGDSEGDSEGIFLERIKIPESDHDTVPTVRSEAPSLRSKHLHRNKHKLKLSKKYLGAGQTKTFKFSNEVVQRYISGDRPSTSETGTDYD